MHSRAKGTADHYCSWAVFFLTQNLGRAADAKGTMSYRAGVNFRPSVGGRGSLRGDRAWGGVAKGLEHGARAWRGSLRVWGAGA